MIYNLAYHVTAVDRPMLWYNLVRLKNQLHRFNGQKFITIVMLEDDEPTRQLMHFTEDELRALSTESPVMVKAVQEFLGDPSIEYFVVKNSELTEANHFFDTKAQYLQSVDPNEITFYGHTKGIRYRTEDMSLPALAMWTDTLYTEVLDRFDDMNDALSKGFSCFGAVKKDGRDFEWCGQPVDWHYSGTFFWFRHDRVFSRDDWYDPRPIRYKLEFMLPRLIPSHEAASPFHLPPEFETTAHLANTFSWVNYLQRVGQIDRMNDLVNSLRGNV